MTSPTQSKPFRFGTKSLFLIIAVLAFFTEICRILADPEKAHSLAVLSCLVYIGSVPAFFLIVLGYGVGQRAGATFATIVIVIIWVTPLVMAEYFFDYSLQHASGIYLFFVLTVACLNLWNAWRPREYGNNDQTETLDRLLATKEQMHKKRG